MKQPVRHDPVRLNTATPDTDDRIVKSVALTTFRAFRWLSDTVSEVVSQAPGAIARAADDIADAWHESSSTPKQ